jgi:hypothetical protein
MRLFTCGFEENNLFTPGASGTTWTAAPGGSVTIVTTTTPHSGLYHLRCPAGSSGAAGPRKDLASARTSGTLYVRAYWKPQTLPTSGTTTKIFSAQTSGSAAQWSVEHVRADNTIRLVNTANSSTIASTTASVTAGTWYRLEVRHLISTSVGELELRLYDGDNTATMTGGTALLNGSGSGEPTTTANIQQFFFGPNVSVNQGQLWYLDDLAINDTAGSFQNSWCGPGKITLAIATVDGGGFANSWTPSTGTDHFALVDDLPGTPDEDTTYISTSTAGALDWFRLTNLTEPPSTATLIVAETNGRLRGNGVTPQVRLKFYDSVSTLRGPTYTLTVSYAPATTANVLVSNLAGKTVADANSYFRHGIELIDALDCRCTALWTYIEWLEATGGGGTNTNIEVPTTIYTGP